MFDRAALGFAGGSGLLAALGIRLGGATTLGPLQLAALGGFGFDAVGLFSESAEVLLVPAGGDLSVGALAKLDLGVAHMTVDGRHHWGWGRESEWRAGARVLLGGFLVGGDWRSYGSNGQQMLTVLVGLGM